MEIGYLNIDLDGNIFLKEKINGLVEKNSSFSKTFKFPRVYLNLRVKTILLLPKILKRSRLESFLKDLDISTDTLNKRIKKLSKSELIKIMAIKMCCSRAKTVLFNHIDTYLNDRDLTALLRSVKKSIINTGKTVIFSTNKIDNIVPICSNYVILENNNVVYRGNDLNKLPIKTGIMKFVDAANEKNAKITYYKETYDLLKAIYRSVKK